MQPKTFKSVNIYFKYTSYDLCCWQTVTAYDLQMALLYVREARLNMETSKDSLFEFQGPLKSFGINLWLLKGQLKTFKPAMTLSVYYCKDLYRVFEYDTTVYNMMSSKCKHDSRRIYMNDR